MDRIIRVWEVLDAMGFSRTTLWRQVCAGKFPPPVQMSPNCVGWFTSEFEAHRASLPRRTYGATTPATQPEPLKRGTIARQK
jgi:prophage regulatory protein